MVSSASRIEGTSQIYSASVQKAIQSIKEVVGDHSDNDIYFALKETNMDPNETAQKLLNQDTFHEVKRKRDKKKEGAANDNSTDQRRHSENVGHSTRVNTHYDRGTRRGVYARNVLPAVSKEFRVVRDNRVNPNTQPKPTTSALPVTSATENASGKWSTVSSKNEKPSASKNSSQVSNGLSDSHPSTGQHTDSTVFVRKEVHEEKRVTVPTATSRVQVGKATSARPRSETGTSSSSAVGVYSSSTDPVHVPSPDSRPSGPVGAIRREVGVVGVRRQSPDNSKSSSVPSSSFSNSLLRGEGSTETYRSFTNASKSDEPKQISESMMSNMSASRSLLGGHYNSRQQHQQPVGHQKALQPNKEWKPKSSQKPRSPGVIGAPTKSVPSGNDFKNLESDVAQVQDKVARVSIHENQNVIIAQHIRVPETDRHRLTFGSFGTEFDHRASSLVNNGFQLGVSAVESNGEPAASLSAPESSVDDASSSKQVDLIDEKIRNSGSDSPPSGAASENQLADKQESSSPRNLDNYADIGLVQDNTPSYNPSESQQQEHSELPGFSAYDSTSYDIPYFRPTMDETMRGHGLQTPQEAFPHNANSATTSTIAMVQQQQQQQQQPPMAQMYPQVHLPHYANIMPYRQFLSPVYVPPMAMPGYSSNPAYPHPSNGNGYVLMPGGGTHLNANSLKYGVQQFKPVPAANPTGFGNFSNPNGYAMNPPGVVGGATGMDDSSRLKYKDGNLYVPNPQAETSEIWIPTPRDLPGLQSTPYYNMPGQSPHAAPYMPSHTAHASFNVAAAQSSHMQFPSLFHPPPQPSGIGNHHLGPAMGGNVGVGVGMAATAPGTQVGAYQQPQLGHLNWTTNF